MMKFTLAIATARGWMSTPNTFCSMSASSRFGLRFFPLSLIRPKCFSYQISTQGFERPATSHFIRATLYQDNCRAKSCSHLGLRYLYRRTGTLYRRTGTVQLKILFFFRLMGQQNCYLARGKIFA
jgi:hypothetical protein